MELLIFHAEASDHAKASLFADKIGNSAIMHTIKESVQVTADPTKMENHVKLTDQLVNRISPLLGPATNLQVVCIVKAAYLGHSMEYAEANEMLGTKEMTELQMN